MANPSPQTHPLPTLRLIINGQITLRESDLPTWLAAFNAVREQVLAEPECLFFHLSRKINTDPLTQQAGNIPEGEVAMNWCEGFDADLEWLGEVQTKKEYYKGYFATAAAVETSRKLEISVGEAGCCHFKA